jgi:hypothetical protein
VPIESACDAREFSRCFLPGNCGRIASVVGKVPSRRSLPPTALRPSGPVQQWIFHQAEKKLTTLPGLRYGWVIEKVV